MEKYNIRSFSILRRKYWNKVTLDELKTCLNFELNQNARFLTAYFVFGSALVLLGIGMFLQNIISHLSLWIIVGLGVVSFLYGITAYYRNVRVIFDEYGDGCRVCRRKECECPSHILP